MTTPLTVINLIRVFLDRVKWVVPRSITFLAAGEYNENYTVATAESVYVFRINHGSQLGRKDQIAYEFQALNAVAESRLTPRPFFYDSNPREFAGGVLLMEYLPGRHFVYDTDYLQAAITFARIHSLPTSPHLLIQENPVQAISDESTRLLNQFRNHPFQQHKKKLLKYRDNLLKQTEASIWSTPADAPCIVNTEVNSGNFIVQETKTYLVDWEKAVVSSRYQDLGHFLVPTTTLWKTEYRFSSENKIRFLKQYMTYAKMNVSLEEVQAKTEMLERTILLRALSWCYMAYFEYTQTDRTLTDTFTLKRISWYLNDMDHFLR